jgi:hypothetical protein
MPVTVHRPQKIIAFSADGIERQAYEIRKQLQDLKINMALLSETYLKPHMRLYIPNYIYRNVKTGTKAELPLQLRKASLTHASTYPLLLSVEVTGVCIPIGNTHSSS